MLNPSGMCQCGCGGKAPIAMRNKPRFGHVLGEPLGYIHGHRAFKTTPAYEVNADGCWVWLRCTDKDGYGKTTAGGKDIRAHRLYYERAKGPIPEGLVIDHLCRNHACVNPDHMEAVTNAENCHRGLLTRLTADDVRAIRRRVAGGETHASVAKAYGVTASGVTNIVNRKIWRSVA